MNLSPPQIAMPPCPTRNSNHDEEPLVQEVPAEPQGTTPWVTEPLEQTPTPDEVLPMLHSMQHHTGTPIPVPP